MKALAATLAASLLAAPAPAPGGFTLRGTVTRVLDCEDVPFRDFEVVGRDSYRLDTDGGGIGCER